MSSEMQKAFAKDADMFPRDRIGFESGWKAALDAMKECVKFHRDKGPVGFELFDVTLNAMDSCIESLRGASMNEERVMVTPEDNIPHFEDHDTECGIFIYEGRCKEYGCPEAPPDVAAAFRLEQEKKEEGK